MNPGQIRHLVERVKLFFGVNTHFVSRLAQSSSHDLEVMSLRRLASRLFVHGRQWVLQRATNLSRFKCKTCNTHFITNPEAGLSLGGALRQDLSGWSSQARSSFVNGLIKAALASETSLAGKSAVSGEFRCSVARRLLGKDSRSPAFSHAPFLGLVGLGLASSDDGIIFTEEEEYSLLCDKLAYVVHKLAWVWDPVKNDPEVKLFESGRMKLRAADLKFGPMVGKGANAAVHAAAWSNPTALFGDMEEEPRLKRLRRGSTETTVAAPPQEVGASPEVGTSAEVGTTDDLHLAVKVMFNYDIMSDAGFIMRAMRKETVPCLSVALEGTFGRDQWHRNSGCLPVHPNVALCYHAFVDTINELPGSVENYGAALPVRINPSGVGRNMSLFLVMKRYETSLQSYLERFGDQLSMNTRILILAQILEGVTHLGAHGIAHRDLKCDNILLDIGGDASRRPQVVLSDFGCCLDDPTLNLMLPFNSFDTDRGGNRALMAPEVVNAVPGILTRIDYSKADVWAVGAVAYELFGNPNPFYGENRLDSATYTYEDLPLLKRINSSLIQRLLGKMLEPHTKNRFSAAVAANVCHILLWGPKSLTSGTTDGQQLTASTVMSWIMDLSMKLIWEARDGLVEPKDIESGLDFLLVSTFLSRMNYSHLKAAAQFVAG